MSPLIPILGGIALLAIVLFQIAGGKRWIKFGRKHLKVHGWTAWLLLAFAVLHAIGSIAYLGFIPLP